MVFAACRWIMPAPHAPLVRAASGTRGSPPERDPAAPDLALAADVQLRPCVEPHPLDDINRVVEAAPCRDRERHAVLVP